MAKLNHVPEDTAKVWIEQHKNTFWKFHDWADEQQHLGKIRGWAPNDYTGRIRAVNEENAKAAGASPGRSALNSKVQGLCADIGKLSLVKVDSLTDSKPFIKIRAFVHDELCITAPGQCFLNEEKTEFLTKKNSGIWTPSYTWDDEAEENAQLVCEEMKAAQSEVLGGYAGLVDYNIAPYWMH